MLETYQESIGNQFEAAFCGLNECIDRCPDAVWHSPIVNHRYCQIVFHALFFADVYLGADLQSLRTQRFHRENTGFFGDYEQLEDRSPTSVYEKKPISTYLQHCRRKAVQVIAAETVATLKKRPGFDWLPFSRAEVHVYNIRHIHHHVAQLSLKLRMDTSDGISWTRSGWKT
jgi:hypothetical protein